MKSYKKPESEKDLTARLEDYSRKWAERIKNTNLVIKRLRRMVG